MVHKIEVRPITDAHDFQVLVGIEEKAYGPSPVMDLMFGGQDPVFEKSTEASFEDSKVQRHV